MYKLYNDLECKFKGEAFNGFHNLLESKHEELPLIFTKSPLRWCWLVCHKVQWSHNLGSFFATNYWGCFASEPYIIFSNVWFSLAPMLKRNFYSCSWVRSSFS
jgi:hypothetical protein